MTAWIVALVMAGMAQTAQEATPWVSFDGLGAAPVQIQTRVPATAALVEGPQGHSACEVTVPSLDVEEKTCAWALDLPPAPAGTNALRVWLRGSWPEPRPVEVAIITPTGSYGAEVPVFGKWTEAVLGPHNTHPMWATAGGVLEASTATQVRLCFGQWLGFSGGPHRVAMGPITALASRMYAPTGPVTERPAQGLELLPQPFTVELLDQERGRWQFVDALGQRLSLGEDVRGRAFVEAARGALGLAYLCCDPEFPEDLGHAVLRVTTPAESSEAEASMRIEEAYFGCGATLRREPDGAVEVTLADLRLGPATQGDRYVAGLYVMVGDEAFPVWLRPHEGDLRLLTDRVGNVFSSDEAARVKLVSLDGQGETAEVALEARDLHYGEVIWQGTATLAAGEGTARVTELEVGLPRYGVFELTARRGEQQATVRLCRVPEPRAVEPAKSRMGINLFQQQIWWYAYQTPLMARAGVHWIRPWLAWENTWASQQPKAGEWDTRALDAALRRMEQHGQLYEDILFAAPGWVLEGAAGPAPPLAKLDEWTRYLTELATRYRGRIPVYEVWNEPDLMWPEATRHSGEHYAALLRAAYAALKAGDPGARVQGLSHAGYEEWLERVGALGVGDVMDEVTFHCYAPPSDFMAQVERRRDILRRHGLGDLPLWINEIGAPAYDFSPEYSARFHCSEATQAAILSTNSALAFSVDPSVVPMWFCTYDPRDSAHELGATWDSGIGVLYLGFLPKQSYVALAGVARELDGRACLGRVDAGGVHQVSFEGPLALVWQDDPTAQKTVAATALGCLPGERLQVRDLFSNPVAEGEAGALTLDLTQGPLYVEGSVQMARVATAEAAFVVRGSRVQLGADGQAQVSFSAPAGAQVVAAMAPGLPVTGQVTRQGDSASWVLDLTAQPGVARAAGTATLAAQTADGLRMVRRLAVALGAPNLVRDPGFEGPNLQDWTPERASRYALDASEGHAVPGSLRLDGPFDLRLVQWDVTPAPERDLHVSAWVRTRGLEGAQVTLNLALFGKEKWLRTWCLAATKASGSPETGWDVLPGVEQLPTGDAEWARVEVTVPGALLPAEVVKGALFVDASGGGAGSVWFDDLDVWCDTVAPGSR